MTERSGRPPDNLSHVPAETGTFRIKVSPRLSGRVANGAPSSAKALPGAGRTPLSTRPLLLQEHNPITNAALTHRDLAIFAASLTQRDLTILISLAAYRYLNLHQLERLFFPSSRSAQIRLKQLKDHGLIQRWKVIEPPGITRRPSVFLLSPRGARVLAASRSEDPKSLVRQARLAELHCLNVTHALEANGLFVELAMASRDIPDQGLYHWVGEAAIRSAFRSGKRRSRKGEAAPASDGWGRYLTPSGEVIFELEWDRGTASLQLAGTKDQVVHRLFQEPPQCRAAPCALRPAPSGPRGGRPEEDSDGIPDIRTQLLPFLVDQPSAPGDCGAAGQDLALRRTFEGAGGEQRRQLANTGVMGTPQPCRVARHPTSAARRSRLHWKAQLVASSTGGARGRLSWTLFVGPAVKGADSDPWGTVP